MHDLRQRHCPISTPTQCKKRVGSNYAELRDLRRALTLGKRMAISGSTMEVRPSLVKSDSTVRLREPVAYRKR